MSRKSSPRSMYPVSLNVAVLGATGAGKSAVVVKFLTRRYISEYAPYLEDTYHKAEVVDGHEIMLNIMDTYDRDSLDTERCMKWADIVLVIYSITCRSHFYRARELLESMSQTESTRDPTIVLVANKIDLAHYRLVNKDEGEQLSQDHGTLFFEIAVTDEYKHIECIFHVAMRRHVRYRRQNDSNGFLGPSKTASLDRNTMRQRSPKPSVIDPSYRASTGATIGTHPTLGHTLSIGSDRGAAGHQSSSSPAKKNSTPFRFFRNIIK